MRFAVVSAPPFAVFAKRNWDEKGKAGRSAGSWNVFRDLGHGNADLGRFTVDRLMAILNRLGSRVEIKVRVRAADAVAGEATA